MLFGIELILSAIISGMISGYVSNYLSNEEEVIVKDEMDIILEKSGYKENYLENK